MSLFCSEITLNINEPLYGSAPTASRFILITWPKKFWKSKALLSDHLPQDIFELNLKLESSEQPPLIRLISSPEISENYSDIYIFPDQVKYSKVTPSDIASVIDSHLSEIHHETYSPEKISGKIITLCTHGTHDQCCAKFGSGIFPVIRQIIFHNKLNISLFESSHIGGHRFAATCMVFPECDCYGRLQDFPLETFLLDFIDKNKIFTDAYRGNILNSRIEQALLFAAFRYINEKNISGIPEITDIQNRSENLALSTININNNTSLKIKLSLKEFSGPTSCSTIDKINSRSVWVIDEISESAS